MCQYFKFPYFHWHYSNLMINDFTFNDFRQCTEFAHRPSSEISSPFQVFNDFYVYFFRMIRFLLFLGLAVTFSAARPAPAEPKLEMGRSDTSSLYDDSRTKKIKEIINKFTPEQKKQIDDVGNFQVSKVAVSN